MFLHHLLEVFSTDFTEVNCADELRVFLNYQARPRGRKTQCSSTNMDRPEPNLPEPNLPSSVRGRISA
jgi:hypothetical protein